MSNIIFYFTGTGNSLSVAQDIANRMKDTEVVPISKAIKEEYMDLPYERIGFVFPVYYSRVPSIVKRFIQKLSFNQEQYIFGIATYAGSRGKTFGYLNNSIKEQGGSLKATFSVRMPGNYIVKYGAFPKIIQQWFFRREKKKVDKISIALRGKKEFVKGNGKIEDDIFKNSIDKIIKNFGNDAKNFYVNHKCTGCTSCSLVCPVDNIKMENKEPKWGNRCEQCMACIQWCPMEAIEYGDKTSKRKRYKHPEITLSDLM